MSVDGLTVLCRWFDSDGVLLCLGITNDIAVREGGHRRMSEWFPYADRCSMWIYPSRDVAECAEAAAIRAEKPVSNRMHNGSSGGPGKRRYVAEHGNVMVARPWDAGPVPELTLRLVGS